MAEKLTDVKALDDTDRGILNELILDSRKSFRDIAKKVNRSVVTVMKKTREMEKNGIITGFSAKIDYDKTGYDMQVIIMIRVSHGNEPKVVEKNFNNPNITAIYDITGDFDLMFVCKFRNRRQLDSFVKKLQTQEYVERTQTSLILNLRKESEVYPLG